MRGGGAAADGGVPGVAALLREASVEVTGVLARLLPGAHSAPLPGVCPLELQADWLGVVGPSSLDLEALMHPLTPHPSEDRPETHHHTGDASVDDAEAVVAGAAVLLRVALHFREWHFAQSFTEVQPPHHRPDPVAKLSSYRAEASRTPRHLTEYTHTHTWRHPPRRRCRSSSSRTC
eukprot:TRINITY_DN132_c0_g1_i16.p3 TRINITY_DN132_c0_g1~~TRINITY_DN132_c0_g1_i16.p3  ORF type:complete len:177 (-),score=21.01 TRINITY_DN132_c0_g1_i16:177-707(-)